MNTMNRIPIVLTFDNNLSLPAAVCISSLLMASEKGTFYDFYVLHSGDRPKITHLEKIQKAFPNMEVHFRSVGTYFSNAFEIRGITKTAYYRLLSPVLIPEYDRVIYTDVDIIYKNDLSSVYSIDLCGNYVAAVPAVVMTSTKEGRKYLESINLTPERYFVSGFQVMDLKAMREHNLVDLFLNEAQKNYKYQDQDILNIVCKDKILVLDSRLSLGVSAIHQIINKKEGEVNPYLDFSVDTAINHSNLHYNGAKPWKDWCPLFDQWWDCYRNSPVYDPRYYFNFFYDKLEYLDQLPLLKRIKILARYFIFGRKQSIL